MARINVLRLALSIVAGGLSAVCGVALLATAAWLISRAAGHPAMVELSLAAVAVRALALSKATMRYLERLLSHDVALRWLGDIRVLTFRHLIPVIPGGSKRRTSGDLLDGMIVDVDTIGAVLVRGITPVFSAVLVSLTAAAFCLQFLPNAFVYLFLLLLSALFGLPVLSIALRQGSSSQLALCRARLTSSTLDVVDGLAELTLNGAVPAYRDRVFEADASLRRLERRRSLLVGVVDTLYFFLGGAALVGALALGVQAVADGNLRPELVASIALCALAMIEVLAALPDAINQVIEANDAASRLLRIAPVPSVDAWRNEHRSLPVGGFDVEFRNVDIRRTADAEVMVTDVSFRLPFGSRMAIVGESGSGKSTIASALVRFATVDRGRLLFDGEDVDSFAADDIRKRVTLVDQESYLFAGTLRDNMRLADADVSDAMLWELAGDLLLEEWIASLPLGWDTLVSEAGTSVSGGEFRRLCVLRGLLRNSAVLILDEPTEHLDDVAADAVLRTVFRRQFGRSLIWITHRLEEALLFDEVLVMREGSPFERGTAKELVNAGGWYASARTVGQRAIAGA
jgi:thiol reductant ABC exporter CydC subunit